jgi:hypothetical protein
VLHCDKVSWFCHIEAPPALLAVLGFNRFGRQSFDRFGDYG